MTIKAALQAVLLGAAGYLIYQNLTLKVSAVTGSTLQDMADKAADAHGVDRAIFRRLVTRESNWNPKAVGPVIKTGILAGQRASGLCQLMPGTALELGVLDVFNPAQNLSGGAKYLSQQVTYFKGDYAKALAAYNAGRGNVNKAIAYAKAHGGRWQERMSVYQTDANYKQTREYVAYILGVW